MIRTRFPRMALVPFASLCLLAAAALSGCGSAPPAPKITEEYFFPPPPDLPRVQFLRSFNGSSDFRRKSAVVDYLAGKETDKDYSLGKAFSVAAWKGKVYVTDSAGARGLNVFDLDNNRFYILGKNPGPGQLRMPINVFIDGEGFKYISDGFTRQVVVLGPDDAFVRIYGDGKSFHPVACATLGKEVYILDIAKDKIPSEVEGEDLEERRDQVLVLDKETGKPLRRIGRHLKGDGGLYFASFMAIDREGNLYISDSLAFRVVKMDPQGNVLLVFGEQGDQPTQFAKPKGIAVDPQGLIHVVDSDLQLVQVFDQKGTLLYAMGGPRAPRGPMDMPAGIWIDRSGVDRYKAYFAPDFTPEYLILVANQLSTQHKIGVYAFGKRKGVSYPADDKVARLDGKPGKALWQMPILPADDPMAALKLPLPEVTSGPGEEAAPSGSDTLAVPQVQVPAPAPAKEPAPPAATEEGSR